MAVWGVFLACWSPGGSCTAASLRGTSFPFARTLWRSADGLPEDTVQAIAESAQGLLWIGTTGGLTRFNGSNLEPQGWSASGLPAAESIFCLTFGGDGSLWAGTEGSGLLRLRGSRTDVYAAAQGLTDGFVRSVFEDSFGRLWVGTDDGLFKLVGGRLRRVDRTAGFRPVAVHSITEDRQHRVWVGGSRLLAIQPDGSETDYTLPGAYSQNRVKRILQTSDGTVWVGTVGGLARLRDGRFRGVPGIQATVRSLLQTADGTLWIGTIGDGLWTLREGRLQHMNLPFLLPSETVLSLLEDDQHQIWIGTQAGLVRLSRTPVSVIALPESGDPDFETISGDDEGNIWVAAQRLYLIRKGVTRPAAYPWIGKSSVRNVFRARDGALWIGTDGAGAYRMLDGSVTHYTAPAELTNNFVRGFLEDRAGAMWVATDEGLSRIRGNTFRKFNESDGLAFFSTRSLLESRDGSLWVGTDRGLSHWMDGRFVEDALTRALAQEKIWSILQDRGGALWFGTRSHGLYRWAQGRLVQFTALDGLPSNSVYQILQDREGTFWLTGPNTIASLPEAEMEQGTPSPDHPLSVEVYPMPFPADGAQMYGGRQPSGYLAPDDSVWFPASRGAAHIAHAVFDRAPAPRAAIEAVSEDGRRVLPGARLVLPAATVRLSFALTAISLRPQTDVRFRYKLENFDRGWNDLANVSAANRVATYTNLRPGSYRFRLQAFDTGNPASVSEFDLPVVKLPFFYERWWFLMLCVAWLALLGWAIYRMRVRQIRTRFAAVFAERGRLAREMHDTVIQGCTGISALLEAVATLPEDRETEKQGLLEYARLQARTTVKEARDAIWNMRHEGEPDLELIEPLEGVATQTTREYGTVVDFERNAGQVPVAASVAHEILMTVREAVYNSVQHGRTGHIRIQLESQDEDLTIAVSDGGCGFSPSEAESATNGHYGIVGMRERMQRVGGSLELSSAPGAGTVVRLRVRRRQR